MIEQLGTEKAKYVSKPCYEMIEYLEKKLSNNRMFFYNNIH